MKSRSHSLPFNPTSKRSFKIPYMYMYVFPSFFISFFKVKNKDIHTACFFYKCFETHILCICFIVFNTTFSNISAISWRPVLVVEEAGVPRENHRPYRQTTDKLYHLRLRVECTLFCNLQSRARTHAVLVIGLYELLGNPTT